MKSVFVVGFSLSVQQAINKSFPAHSGNGSITWVAEGRGVATDVAKFKEVFNSTIIARNPAEAMVLFAMPGGSEWVEAQLAELIAKIQNHYPACNFMLNCVRDFGNATLVEAQITAFGLLVPEQITVGMVSERLGGNKVICISADGCTSVVDALLRAGFPKESTDQYFDQEIIGTGRNSTLMAHLETYSKSHHHMLYSWQNLRTSSGGLVKAFKRKGTFFEASSASKVVEMFRRFIVSSK